MARRRPKTVFEFLGVTDPGLQDFAARVASEWLAPGLANAAKAVRRGVHFPRCAAHGCGDTGVGVCEVCTKTFCAGHGLLYVVDVLEPDSLSLQLEGPVGGLCLACSRSAVAALLEKLRTQAPPRANGRTRPKSPGYGPEGFAEPGEEPKQPFMPRPVAEAYSVLGLDWRKASPEAIRRRQRQLAKTEHPDVGGGQDMAKINAAAEIAVRWATEHPVEAA